jgi:hypothetical protein
MPKEVARKEEKSAEIGITIWKIYLGWKRGGALGWRFEHWIRAKAYPPNFILRGRSQCGELLLRWEGTRGG